MKNDTDQQVDVCVTAWVGILGCWEKKLIDDRIAISDWLLHDGIIQ